MPDNFLIPQGKATLATASNKAKFEARRAELEAKAAAELAAAQARGKQFEGKVIRNRAQAGTEGKLFGSIGTVDIAEECASSASPSSVARCVCMRARCALSASTRWSCIYTRTSMSR